MIYIDLDSIKPNPRAGATVSHVHMCNELTIKIKCIPECFLQFDYLVENVETICNHANKIEHTFTLTSTDDNLIEFILSSRIKLKKVILEYSIEAKSRTIRHHPLPSHSFKFKKHRVFKPMFDEDYDTREFETIEHALERKRKRDKRNGKS